jgi:hypothetical protein
VVEETMTDEGPGVELVLHFSDPDYEETLLGVTLKDWRAMLLQRQG